MTPAAAALSTASRTAGAVMVLSWLVGIVPGSVVAVIGGLALVAFGRALALTPGDSLAASAGMGVFALGLVAGAERWSSLSLADVTGAQAVLGPTLLVAPQRDAVGAWLVLFAAIGGASLFAATRPEGDSRARKWLESGLLIVAMTTVFAGPALIGASDPPLELGLVWTIAGLSIGLTLALVTWFLRNRSGPLARATVVGVGTALWVAGALLLGS